MLTNQAGTRATGVEYYDAQKQRQVQEADVVILAAWSAQNPRILLNSATDKHPKGLANSNELVGKFMMTHHIAGTWALFDEDITPHMGTVGAQFMSYDRYAKTSYPGAFGSSFIAVGTSHKTNDFALARGDLFGAEFAAYHEAGRARPDPPDDLRRRPAQYREPRRTRQRQGRVTGCRWRG